MLQKIRNFLSVGNRALLAVFCLFSLTIFLKVTLFHWFCFHSIMISSIFTNPLGFFAFWLPKISISLFIASFCFLFPKSQWWTIVFLLIVDVWIIANLLYYKANGLLLTYDAIQLSGNLSEITSSVQMYVNWNTYVMLLLTIVYSFLVLLLPITKCNYIFFSVSLCVSILLSITGGECLWQNLRQRGLSILFQDRKYPHATVCLPIYGDLEEKSLLSTDYIKTHSILMYATTLRPTIQSEYLNGTAELTERENFILHNLIDTSNNANHNISVKSNIIVILVESFESWAIGMEDDKGNKYLPNLSRFAGEKANLYAPYIKSQAKHGVSGDGQMIINSGLLPLEQGVACDKYGDNTYPNWAQFFANSAIIAPWPHIWNQDTMTIRYGYNSLLQPEDGSRWTDEKSMPILTEAINKFGNNYAVMYLTLNSHSPFIIDNMNTELSIPTDMPIIMQNYLTCLHLTDRVLGSLISELEENGNFDNTTLVITGDHTIFKDMMLREFKPYAEAHNLPIKDGKNYVPLIIYSPEIKENIKVDEECYQMDIYPTIMHLIGCEDYYWKGFGINLLDSAARHNRPCTEEEAYKLSDKLIRSNYFKK